MPGALRPKFVARYVTSILLLASLAAHAQITFDLPSQPLSRSLLTVANLGNVNLLYDPDVVDGLQAPALKANVSADEALARLLEGTGLSVVHADGNTVRVVSRQRARPAAIGTTYSPPPIHFADANDAANVSAVASGDAAESDSLSKGSQRSAQPRSRDMDEVVVSAEKREERLQDVPIPVSVIATNNLIESNQVRMQDYFTKIPGLNVTPDDQYGAPQLTIRGITTGGYTNPTVGIVIDDVPYGSSSNSALGSLAPDVDPFDLARIEVLRGPQGTLYGAASMGGLLKYVTIDPSFDSLKGAMQAGVSGVRNGAQAGYNFRGAVNAPLGDNFAIRASAFTRLDPGYIDNPVLNVNGINKERVSGGLLAALWQASDATSVKLNALYQEGRRDGSNDFGSFDSQVGDLQQSFLRGTGKLNKQIQSYSATVKQKLGPVELTSITAYNISRLDTSLDLTYYYGSFTQDGIPGTDFNGFGVTGSPSFVNYRTTKFTQELRAAGPLGQHIDWLLGGFFTREQSSGRSDTRAEDPATGADMGDLLLATLPTTYKEYAAFADLTFRITDRLDVQVGARESHNQQTFNETDTGPFVPLVDGGASSPYNYPYAKSTGNAFTYLLTPRLKLSPDLMLYVRIASGYRPGGPNPGAAARGLPSEFSADRTENYEIGAKGDWLGHKLSFDASLYYIDWKDMQLLLLDPNTGVGYYSNGPRAKSQGLELSLDSRPVKGLTVSTWVTLGDAKLKSDFPPLTDGGSAHGLAGDRLPYSSRFSGNFSLEEAFPLWSTAVGFVGGSVTYVGERQGEFASAFATTFDRQPLPGYAQTDLRAGARQDTWSLTFFANNVTDRRGMLRGGLNSVFPFAFNFIQPRTIGASLTKSF